MHLQDVLFQLIQTVNIYNYQIQKVDAWYRNRCTNVVYMPFKKSTVSCQYHTVFTIKFHLRASLSWKLLWIDQFPTLTASPSNTWFQNRDQSGNINSLATWIHVLRPNWFLVSQISAFSSPTINNKNSLLSKYQIRESQWPILFQVLEDEN